MKTVEVRGILNTFGVYSGMYDNFQKVLIGITSLDEVAEKCLPVIKVFIDQYGRLGYASGIISSDGPVRLQVNIKRLVVYTERIRSRIDFPIFSPTDIFSYEVFDKLKRDGKLPPQKDFIQFWRVILESGITDIFMTPRWRNSEGSIDEYNTALKLGIKIHDLYPSHPLLNGEKGLLKL